MAATSTKELTATGASVTTVSAGEPTAAVVPAGQCAIGEDWTPCPLLERIWISKDTIVVRPDEDCRLCVIFLSP